MDKSVDKGKGLRILEEYMGIDSSQAMAFGDNDNDIGLLLQPGKAMLWKLPRRK